MTEPAPDTADTSAAELALGLLEGEERASAMRRVLADPAFAAAVTWWRDHFATLFALVPEVEPSAAVLARVERALDAPAAKTQRFWPVLAMVSSLAAVLLLALLLTRPVSRAAPVPPAPAPMLAAAVAPVGSGAPIPVVWDAARDQLRLGGATLADAGHSAELWVIGADAVPHSLGVLQRGGRTLLVVAPNNRPRLMQAAVLAITVEPLGGSPSGKPTGPIVAKGILERT